MRNEPVYRLPPDLVMQAVTTPLSETIDWSQKFVGLPEAWQQTAGEGIVLAVLDTGVDTSHPDLEGQILDVRDFTGSIFGPEDQHGHGSHTTGTCVANANEIGVRGACYKAKALHAKVLGDDGAGTDGSIEQGMLWAHAKGAHIFSLSLGGPQMSERLHRVFMDIAADGKFIFAASGNDGGRVNYPGAWPETIGVGAADKNGRLTRFTSRGPELDIIAPGVDILSTIPGGRYAVMSGTSMATPLAASIGALALAKHKKVGGDTDLTDVPHMREHLKRTAKATPDGYGLIDPIALLKEQAGDSVTDDYPLGPYLINLGPVHLKVYAKLQ